MSQTEQIKEMQKVWRNKAVADTYEPGSTFKLVTASAALEEGITTTDKEGEDITYNRVLVQAIMPTQIDEYNEIYTLAYSLDIRRPIYKVYKAMFNNTTNSIIAFDPN